MIVDMMIYNKIPIMTPNVFIYEYVVSGLTKQLIYFQTTRHTFLDKNKGVINRYRTKNCPAQQATPIDNSSQSNRMIND